MGEEAVKREEGGREEGKKGKMRGKNGAKRGQQKGGWVGRSGEKWGGGALKRKKRKKRRQKGAEIQNKGPKRHMNFVNMNFLAHPKPPILGPPEKKFMCLISWERTHKRDPHKLFRGDLRDQKRGPKRAIVGHKKFLALIVGARNGYHLSLWRFFSPVL